MMKKRILKTMAGVVCVMTIMSVAAFADTNNNQNLISNNTSEEKVKIELISENNIIEQFDTVTGVVTKVVDNDEYKVIHIQNEDMGMVFTVASEVFVVEQKSGDVLELSDIKKDMKITAVLPKNYVMTMSIPPQTPSAVGFIINNGDDKVELLKYEDFIKSAHDNSKEDTYVELRAEAESKGYVVEWTSNSKPIILTKNDMKIEITIESDQFKFEHLTKDLKPLDRMEKLNMPVILEEGKTMITSSFIDALE